MGKFSEYTRGRDDGLYLAHRLVKEGGIEALNREIRARCITGIHTSLREKELDERTEELKQICFETVLVGFLSILNEEFGFGQVRLQRAMDRFQKLETYLAQGWVRWSEMVEELRTRMGVEFVQEYINKARIGKEYAHPEPEDIYGIDDLIDMDAWRKALKTLKFTERKNPDGKDRFDIYDEKGKPYLQYEGAFGRIQMYDMLSGMIEAKNHWGIK